MEAPALHTPTINIGDRQKGRMMAESIVCCEPRCKDIVEAMEKALTDKFQKKAMRLMSPFGDGTTSDRIMSYIKKFLDNKCYCKRFYDIDF